MQAWLYIFISSNYIYCYFQIYLFTYYVYITYISFLYSWMMYYILSMHTTKNHRYENWSHFWENVRFGGVDKIDLGGRKMSKNTLNVCSHIQKNAQNPNQIFKITIHCTKYTNNVKIHSKFWTTFEHFEKTKVSIL